MGGSGASRARLAAGGIIPVLLLAAVIVYVTGPGGAFLDRGTALPEVVIEQVEFHDSEIRATIRNTGPMETRIAQADINDRIQPAAIEPDALLGRLETALVRIPYDWNEAESYSIGITTDDGTRFERLIGAAAPAVEPDAEYLLFFAIVGTYVGVVPVAIGLLWFPFISRLGRGAFSFFLALTLGMLIFLGIESVREATEIGAEFLEGALNTELLVATTAISSFLGLYYAGRRLSGGSRTAGYATIALMIAISIGLHNFGEGLAIGAAVGLGSMAFGAFLIVGFAIHNTTEGVAIAAPMSRGAARPWRLVMLGAIAGVPTIFGAWVGGFAFSPASSIIFLSVGAGAILQVILSIAQWMRSDENLVSFGAPTAAGVSAGMLIMYLTGLLI